MTPTLRTLALAAAALALPLAAQAARTPEPAPFPSPKMPTKPLQTQVIVEVNNRGQVVRVMGGKLSHDNIFDTMTIGNALQMWIREPSGKAVPGLFRVTYNYTPRDHKVHRSVALIKPGGSWAKEPGAATRMVQTAEEETKQAYARIKAQEKRREEQSAKHLPDINAAVKRALATPSPHP